MTPSPALSAPTRVRWRIVALLMGLCLISHLNRAAMPVAGTDRIMSGFAITETQMGAIYSVFLLVYSLCMIPGGLFIDRFGPRRALLVMGFGSAIFGALTGLVGLGVATGSALLLNLTLVRGTMGFLSAPLHPAAARAVANWFPFAQRSWANGLVTAAAIAGIAIAPPGFGALIKAVDWPMAFVICAGITVALTALWMWYSTDSAAQHPDVNAGEKALILCDSKSTAPSSESAQDNGWLAWLALLVNRNLLLVTLSYAAVGYFQYLFVYWMQFYLAKVLSVGDAQSKYYSSILQVALAFGMPLGGWLSTKLSRSLGVRRGRALVSGGGMALSATLLGLGVLSCTGGTTAPNPIWLVFWLGLAHAALGAAEGPIWATAVDIGASKGGTAAAICNAGGNLGGLLAPVATPWIAAQYGWEWGIGLGGIICFLGALCWCWINPRDHSGHV